MNLNTAFVSIIGNISDIWWRVYCSVEAINVETRKFNFHSRSILTTGLNIPRKNLHYRYFQFAKNNSAG